MSTVFCLILSAGPLAAEESWESLNKDAKRAEINEAAKEALDEVLAKSENASGLHAKAYGWAAFDNLRSRFGCPVAAATACRRQDRRERAPT